MTTSSRKLQERELHIASLSDIHLGHPRTPTTHILRNLNKVFPDNEVTKRLDLIILAGDVFDRLLKFSDPDIYDIELWIHNLLRMAARYNIVVRVLEGTPSHDWKQSSVFERINDNSNIGCNLKYVKQLSIETIPELDSTILYIPDEWAGSTEVCLSQVQELMTSKGLTRVDYAIMHGHFPHQLPIIATKSKVHDTDFYLRIVDKLIFIGHDHHFSLHERIIAHGSFDRLIHGEEGPKGHIRAKVRSRDDFEVTFVENKGAMIFKTIQCGNWTVEEALSKLGEIVVYLPKDSRVRIVCSTDSPLAASMTVLENTWPGIVWSKKVEGSDGETIQDTAILLGENDFVPIEITKENVIDLVMAKMVVKTADETYLAIAQQFLEEVR